jgi:hypothetical protein
MNPILFVSEAKRVAETISYFGDFRDVLLPGELITSESVVVNLVSGTDTNPSNLLYLGILVHNQTVIEQRIRLGIAGNIYDIIFTVSTNQGNTYEKTTRLAILPNEGASPSFHTNLWLTTDLYPYNIIAEAVQGDNIITGGNFWYQPSYTENFQGNIVLLNGSLFQASISYNNYIPEHIQGNISIINGTLVQALITYNNYIPEAIRGGIAVISGNLYQGSVSYITYQPELIQGNITLVSGILS